MTKVNTTQYQFSHNKKPRGNGMWCFGLDDKTPLYVAHMNYAAAKKDAIKHFEGFDEIFVLP